MGVRQSLQRTQLVAGGIPWMLTCLCWILGVGGGATPADTAWVPALLATWSIWGTARSLERTVVQPLQQLSRLAGHVNAAHASTTSAHSVEWEHVTHVLRFQEQRLCEQEARFEQELQTRTAALRHANEELAAANQSLAALAITDGLTGLYNHRHFQHLLALEIQRQRRNRIPFSVLMFDVDHFKHYNDHHGHPAGDTVLQKVARILRQNTRAEDIVARYGGEEFVVLLYGTKSQAALAIAETLRSAIATHGFPQEDTQPLGLVSVSVGVSTWPDDGEAKTDLIDAADRALYAAKNAGRNRVKAYGAQA